MQPANVPSPAVGKIVFLCFLVAVFEGLDIQAMGVAAPALAPAFRLTPAQMGQVMSASTLGLMVGAAAGGWLSDAIGRARVIVLAMVVLAVFSLATVVVPGYASLRVIRVLAGLGLGGAFPNLIAMISECSPSRNRTTSLAWMYIGLPVGGAIAGLVASWTAAGDWRPIFYAGGLGPLLLAPILLVGLPKSTHENAPPAQRLREQHAAGDIAPHRPAASVTLRLWASYFFTLLVVYLLLNWLPSLVMAAGYSHRQAAHSAIILNAGAILGSLALGRLTDLVAPRHSLVVTYLGMAASLLVVAFGQGESLFAGAFLAGGFVIGGQLILYAMAPALYPTQVRGTGVGAAVAAGRLGSISGPVLAGLWLSHGFEPNTVPLIALPGLLLAFAAALSLARRPELSRAPARALE
jgi:MFS transporter, AAHS family, 3-hydroxyphenylpropionic acid transporter